MTHFSQILPGAASQFELELLPAQPDGVAAMQIGSKAGKVLLKGTGGVELASALNWYLNDYLNATYDWNTCVFAPFNPHFSPISS